MPSVSLIARLVAILFAASTAASTSVTQHKSNLRRRAESALICLILKVQVTLSTGGEGHLECDLISEDDGSMVHGLQIQLPENVVEDHQEALHRGEWFVQISGAKVEETLIDGYGSLRTSVSVPAGADIVTIAPEQGDLYMEAVQSSRTSRSLSSVDRSLAGRQSRRLMVIRVSTSDKSPTYSAAQLQQYYFDLSSYSVARQYALCSSSWLWFKPYNSAAPVVNVYVAGSAASFTKETLWAAALVNVQNQLGVTSISSVADNYAIVLPQGLQGGVWYGFGTVGGPRTVFSDTFAGIPNTAMHELGHNLGLNHAGMGSDQYNDETDLMGYGAYQQFGPSKCFNGVHLWNLNWMTDRAVTIDAFTHTIIQLASFADYSKTTSGQYVVVKVGSFYLVYNKASGVNSGTAAVPNMVTIAENGVYSVRVGAINATTAPFQVANYQGSTGTLYIKVCQVGTTSNGITVSVLSIGVNNMNCS